MTDSRKSRQRRRAKGLCYDCSEPVFPGHTRCGYHLNRCSYNQVQYRLAHPEQEQKREQEKREKRKKEGRCLRCGAPVETPGDLKCPNCRIGLSKIGGSYEIIGPKN